MAAMLAGQFSSSLVEDQPVGRIHLLEKIVEGLALQRFQFRISGATRVGHVLSAPPNAGVYELVSPARKIDEDECLCEPKSRLMRPLFCAAGDADIPTPSA